MDFGESLSKKSQLMVKMMDDVLLEKIQFVEFHKFIYVFNHVKYFILEY